MGIFDSLSNLSPEQTQGLLAAAAQMLQQSGPSRMPVGLGQIAGGGLQAYQGGVDEAQKRRMQQEQAAQESQLYGLKIKGLEGELQDKQIGRDRQLKIQSDLANLFSSQGTNPAAPAPSPAQAPAMASAAPGGAMSPKIGGPDWLQAYQSQQPETSAPAMQVPPTGAQPMLGASNNSTEAYASRLLKEAEVYSKNGDFAGADQRYQAASKLLPLVDKVEPATDPQSGKLVNVITFKDGSQKVSAFGVKPDFKPVDQGGKITIEDFNAMKPGQSFSKTATPGEILSNSATIRGQNLTNQRALDALNVPQFNQEAGGFITRPTKEAPGGTLTPLSGYTKPEKPLTEAQGKATLFVSRMNKANQIMDDLSKAGVDNTSLIKSGLESVPLIGNSMSTAGNFAASSEQQRLEQAQRDFVNATLRQESGAAISNSEFDSAKKQYFPQRGDSKATLEQKATNRQTAIQGMAIMAGPGASKVDVGATSPAPKKTATLADIAVTAQSSGKTTAEVTKALRDQGYTIGGQ